MGVHDLQTFPTFAVPFSLPRYRILMYFIIYDFAMPSVDISFFHRMECFAVYPTTLNMEEKLTQVA